MKTKQLVTADKGRNNQGNANIQKNAGSGDQKGQIKRMRRYKATYNG